MSDIRFNQWLHNSGTGGVSQVDGGHVGIGTTNPEIAVHSGNNKILNVGIVTASTYYGDGSNLTNINSTSATGDFSIADTIKHIGDTNTKIRFPEADAVTIETNGNERLRINSSGSWGIGSNFGTSGQFLKSQGSGSAPTWATVDQVIKKIHSFEYATRVNASSSSGNAFTWTTSFIPLDPVNNSFWICGSVPVNLAGNDYCGFGLRIEKSGGGVTDFNGYGVQYNDLSQAHMGFYGYNFTTSSSFSGAGTYTIFHRQYTNNSNPDAYAPNSADDSRLSAQTRGYLQIIEYKNA